jgi:hypothetical protein
MPTETIELRVSCDCGASVVWCWVVRIVNDSGTMTLHEGTSDTRIAAQMAAQDIFEQRLPRAGLSSLFARLEIWEPGPCGIT